MRRLAFVALAAFALPAQEAALVDPEVILLARIKTRAEETLSRLPNFTCQESVERSRRLNPRRRFDLVDTLRLEVALVNGNELFAWPGSGRFEDRLITDMVSTGTIGTGDFGMHARGVLLSGVPRFRYAGEGELGGRKTERFDYDVPRNVSGYSMRVGENQDFVGYRGSIQVDTETLDLRQLIVDVIDIPKNLPVKSARTVLEYQQTAIGEGKFLLPHSSEIVLTDSNGSEHRNRISFQACRQYTGESVLSFEDPEPKPEVEQTPPAEQVELPSGKRLTLVLDSTIPADQIAIGEPLTALLYSDVKEKDRVLLRKGVRFFGRVTYIERGANWLNVRLQFFEFENGAGRSQTSLELFDAGPSLWPGTAIRVAPQTSDIWIGGARAELPLGMRTLWTVQ